MTSKTKLQWALELVDAGFAVFPLQYTLPDGQCSCGSQDCKDHPKKRGKHPLRGSNGVDDATLDKAEIKKIWTKYPEQNIGVSAGDKHLIVDLDVTYGKHGDVEYAKVLGIPKDDLLKQTYTVETPTGGLHMYYRVDEPKGNSANKMIPGVDTRGVGGYVVGPGSTRHIWDVETEDYIERPYRVIGSGKIAKLPKVIDSMILASRTRSDDSEVPEVEGRTDHPTAIFAAQRMLKKRKPAIQGSGGDDHTIATVFLVRDYDISAEKCIELLTEEVNGEPSWNDRCDPPWDFDELEKKVENGYAFAKSRPGNKGGSILDMVDETEEDSILPEDLYVDEEDLPERKNHSLDERFLSANDFVNLDIHYTFVVEDWIPMEGVTFLNAKRGGGKSTSAMDIACCVANDKDWHGTPVERGMTVFYVAAEDDTGVKSRLEAWNMKHLGTPTMPNPSRLVFLRGGFDVLNRAECLAFAKMARKRVPPGTKVLLVIDTWQRVTSKAESQSNEAQMQTGIHNCEALGRTFEGPVLVLTHPPDNNPEKVMGSTIIENESSAIIQIGDAIGGVRTIRVTRIKGAEGGSMKTWKLVSQQISGTNKRGKPNTAALFQFSGGNTAAGQTAGISEDEVKKLRVIYMMVTHFTNIYPEHKGPVARSDIADLAYDLFMKVRSPNKTAHIIMQKLREVGFKDGDFMVKDRAKNPLYSFLLDVEFRFKDGVKLGPLNDSGDGMQLELSFVKNRQAHIPMFTQRQDAMDQAEVDPGEVESDSESDSEPEETLEDII